MKQSVPTCQLGYMQAIKQKKLTKLSYSTFEFIKLPSISASLCDVAILAVFGGYFGYLFSNSSFLISVTIMDGFYIVLWSFWYIALT